MTYTIMLHDPRDGDNCPCLVCGAKRDASLAVSRATCAIQAAAWHRRSKRLAATAAAAIIERRIALDRLDRITASERRIARLADD